MNEYPLRRPVMRSKPFILLSATVLALIATAPYRAVQKLSGCMRETLASATLNHDDSQYLS
jgi:hypothetical protein